MTDKTEIQRDGSPLLPALPGPVVLPLLHRELQIMMASAVPEGGDWVEGYRIKTGAIHRILGIMQQAGFPIILPPCASHTTEQVKQIKKEQVNG